MLALVGHRSPGDTKPSEPWRCRRCANERQDNTDRHPQANHSSPKTPTATLPSSPCPRTALLVTVLCCGKIVIGVVPTDLSHWALVCVSRTRGPRIPVKHGLPSGNRCQEGFVGHLFSRHQSSLVSSVWGAGCLFSPFDGRVQSVPAATTDGESTSLLMNLAKQSVLLNPSPIDSMQTARTRILPILST